MSNYIYSKRIMKEINMLRKEEYEIYGDLDTIYVVMSLPNFEGFKYSRHCLEIDLFSGDAIGFPFKAPVLKVITMNGRTEGPKITICISGLSHYHNENWSPSTSLVSLVEGFKSTLEDPDFLGIGYLKYDVEKIKQTCESYSKINEMVIECVKANSKI